MNATPTSDVTQLLVAWGNGDREAFNKLFELVYEELHFLASRHMLRENPGNTLQTSALVNEAYLKLIDQKKVEWRNRGQFFCIAAQAMRRILVDHARSRARAKRGGDLKKMSFDETALLSPDQACELVELDHALNNLAEFDLQKSRIVEMKFFGGFTNQEIAEIENVSSRTIDREWRKAKAWLQREIQK